jgi:hypothetical protein
MNQAVVRYSSSSSAFIPRLRGKFIKASNSSNRRNFPKTELTLVHTSHTQSVVFLFLAKNKKPKSGGANDLKDFFFWGTPSCHIYEEKQF